MVAVFPVLAVLVIFMFVSVRTISQGTVGVTTVFGKYRRVLRPGLHVLIPFVEKIESKISLQNRATELKFAAISSDQANVLFTAMLLYSVANDTEENVKTVAFKFIDPAAFNTALVRTIEGAVRGFVAGKKQAEILSLRGEIVTEIKDQLDHTIGAWGYHLQDVQINDIAFDQAITASMAKVVASLNERAAAENEGQALLIRKTKEAEATGAAIRIQAEAEAAASQKRGEGIALFRAEVAKGMTGSLEALRAVNGDEALLTFTMWTETLRDVAEHGRGNVLFLDGSPQGLEGQMKQLAALSQLKGQQA